MSEFYTAFILLHGVYLLVIMLVLSGLLRLRKKHCHQTPTVSVVIAARNEEKRISPTLESLEKINYPADRYEVIFVDDASTDRTRECIEPYIAKHKNWSLITLTDKSSELKGKKKALKLAIEQARGEIIFTTDADCTVPSEWLKHMVCYFDAGTSMVLGHSPLVPSSGFKNILLAFDNLFSAISAAAPTKLGFANTSVGRNLAYRKNVYQQVGGFDSLRKFKSGDDVHLTERFRYGSKGRIDYCADPETFVHTQPPKDGKQFLHQQIRKNSKTLKKSPPSIMLSVLLFFYHILLVAFPLLVPAKTLFWLVMIMLKILMENITLSYAAWIFQKKQLIKYLLLMQVIYPIYIIFFSLLGVLQIYEWKK